MRTFKTYFLPFCFCVFALVVSLTTFAGNGVERGTGWMEWSDLTPLVQPQMREAVESSMEAECPQMIEALGTDVLLVESMRVIAGNSNLAGADSWSENAPIVELTLRRSSDDSSRIKVRMAMQSSQGFMSHIVSQEGSKKDFSLKVLEWIGVEAIFGTDFGLKNAR